jgi:hypothetical protein
LQQAEKKVNEEVKAILQDSASSSKESVEEEPKIEESPSPATPLSKPEEVSENEKIEPLIAGVKKIDDAPNSDLPVEDNMKEEKESIPDSHTPKIEESPSPATPLSKPEEVSENEKIEPLIAGVKKIDDAPNSDLPVEDNMKEEKESIPDSHTPSIPVAAADTSNIQPAVEFAVKEVPYQVAIASLEKGQEEKPNVVDIHEPIAEAVEKLEEPLDVHPAKESEAVGINEIKDSDVEYVEVEKLEAAATETDEKPVEQSELIKQAEIRYEEVQPEAAATKTKENPGEQSELIEQTEVTYEEVQPEALATETKVNPGEQSELITQAEITYGEVQPEAVATETKEKPGEQSEIIKQAEITYEEVQPEAAATETKENPGEQSELIKQAEITYGEVQPEAVATETKEKPGEQSEIIKEAEITYEEVQPEPAATETEEKAGEQSELVKQVEKTYEEVDTAIDTDTGTLADKDENILFVKEEQIDKEEEPSVIISSEQVLTNQEAQTDLKEDGRDFFPPSIVSQKVDAEDKKEFSGVDAVEELSKEVVVDTGKVAEENEAKTVEIEEENEKRNVITEESTPAIKEEDVNTSISTSEVIEKSSEGENTSGDVEVIEENKEEQNVQDKIAALAETNKDEHLEEKQAEVSIKGENAGKDVEVVEENKGEQNVIDKIPALFETNKDEHLEEKQAEATTVVSELLKESHESELQVGSEKTVETGEDKLEKEKVDEVAKSEVENLEPPINVGDEIKTSQDLPKELPAKSTQKQSNNIISKVKQSLVKAKKAIIGKSPSSKTLSSDTKGDIKVK